MDEPAVIRVDLLTEHGGRVDWSHDGQLIAFDRVGPDGLYDIWTMHVDGSDARNLTETDASLGLPPGHKGNPAWHPGGDWLVIQVERSGHPGVLGAPATHPGAGYFNDLWLLRRDGSEAKPFVVLPTDVASGALHPHFSDDGSRLVFSSLQSLPSVIAPGEAATFSQAELAQRIEDQVTTMFGSWALATVDLNGASLDAAVADPASLKIHTTRIADRSCFLEAHAALADGTVLVSANAGRFQAITFHDVLVVDPSTGDVLRRVTNSPDEWNEHAHPTNSGSNRIIFNSSRDLRPDERYPYSPGSSPLSASMPPRVDLWIADADNTRRRLTFFNDPTWPHALSLSEHVFVSDFCLSLEGDRIVAAVHLLEPPPFVSKTVIIAMTFDGVL